MTKRWLGFSVVLIVLGLARVASAQTVSISPVSPVNTGSAAVGAETTSPTITMTASAGPPPTVKFVVDPLCADAARFTFPGPVALTGNPGTGTFTVTFTGGGARGAHTCSFQIQDNTSNAVLGTFNVTGFTNGPIATVTGTATFGNVRVNDMAVAPTSSQVFTVTNTTTDGSSLQIDSIAFSGTNPADWSVTAGPTFPVTLAQDANAQWTITFNPSASGGRSAVMTVASNDPTMPNRTTNVSGTGTLAIIGLSDVSFGIITAGTTSSVLNSTLSNSETGVLTASTATISGSTWFTFGTGLGCTAGSTACTLVGATAPASKSIPVRCSPPAGSTATETALLTVASDTDAGGDNVAMLSCTGGKPNIVLSTTSIDFGNQAVNTTSGATANQINVANNGNQNLTFWFEKSGNDTGMFAAATGTGCGVNSTTLCTVAAGTSMNINVTFSPTSIGTKTATLTIRSNDPDPGDNAIAVGLTGVGTAPVASPNMASLPFGNVEVGKTHAGITLIVTNTGNATLTISNAGFTTGAADYIVPTGMGTLGAQTTMLGPNATAQWTIACRPTTQGSRPGTFRVTSNGLASSQLDIGLACNGQRGVLAMNPTSHDFGGVRAGDTRTTTFTLSNTGNVPVNNIQTMLDSKLLGFSVSGVPTSLANGAQATVTVTFLPPTQNDGCQVVNAGDCAITIYGGWGVTPTNTQAIFVAQGDGLNATFDTFPASPNMLDFGMVRYDVLPVLPVEVINTGGSPLKITNLQITPTGSTAIGELRIVSCSHNSVGVACPNGTMTTHFTHANVVNDKLLVNVQCFPADRTGLVEGTLTVTSDLATLNTRTLAIRCTATTAALATDPMTMELDFGATDLDAIPVTVTRTITLTNMGAAPLDLGAAVRSGTNLARFAFGATPGMQVAPGGQFSVDVSYTPLAERHPSSPDVAAITWPLDGIAPATPGGTTPTSVTINIKGYGADRHISVGATPLFPDTFKNPGDAAPVMPVKITNTGFAPLDVTAVMLDNAPIWTLQNPDPVQIPADSSYDFNVVFAPLMAGKAPTGQLVVMNNDNERTLVTVELDGNGLSRNVAMGPRVIPLGFTGIGLPIRLSDISPDQLLDVVNMDEANGFRIARISVDSIIGADGTFAIVDPISGDEPVDLELAPSGLHSFDITFTPTEVGDFEALATLYLDQDQSAQAQVTLRGRGLYVDARGGGGFGCSTSEEGGSRGWLVLVLGTLLLARRRRALGVAGGLAMIAVVLAQARPSAAQSHRNLDLNVFEPMPSTVGTTFHVQDAKVGANGTWSAMALVTYANNALVLDTTQNDNAAIANRALLGLGGSYVFAGRFEASAQLPIVLQSGDPQGDPTMRFGIDPASGAALADAMLNLKAQLGLAAALGGTLAYGAAVTFTLPTATDGEFAGTDNPTARLLLLGSLSHHRLTTTINAGGILRSKTQFANITQGSGVAWGAGATYRVIDALWASAEAFGEVIPGGKTDVMGEKGTLNTTEGLVGVHYRPARTMSLGVALGRGLTTGPGTPALRGILSFSFTPSAEAYKPIHKPRPATPPRDDDMDGIPNSLDECPFDKEDIDLFEDDDGCPDLDNDKDGIPDAVDKCPLDAEDFDRFEDEDGCPDKDNDGDGIPDAKDKCPNAPEDKDGFEDSDGCPDLDNDKDGIPDSVDKCPLEPETINGFQDDDGCPDKGNSLVVLSPDRLELLEAVVFRGTKIDKSSANVLGQLGAHLRANPEILRVRLSVHVQPTRNPAADLKLSEARATAVREWLSDWGIDPLRLQSSGFGGKQPLVPPTTKGAQMINDRLELIILERK